jgi:hypothetical protein
LSPQNTTSPFLKNFFFQFEAYKIPQGSPLRNVEPFFWHPRPNDSGVAHPESFYGLATRGKIDLYNPACAVGYGPGHWVLLQDGRKIAAAVVIVATGYRSSWEDLFDGDYTFRPPSWQRYGYTHWQIHRSDSRRIGY